MTWESDGIQSDTVTTEMESKETEMKVKSVLHFKLFVRSKDDADDDYEGEGEEEGKESRSRNER